MTAKKSKKDRAWRALDFMNAHPAFDEHALPGYVQGCLFVYALNRDERSVDARIDREVDKIVYGLDIPFCVYTGSLGSKKGWMDLKNWTRYEGVRVRAGTFENVILLAAKKTIEIFGAFDSHSSFMTEEEVENNKKEEAFFFKPSRHLHRGERCSEMIRNPNHIDVSSAVINRRWLAWFVKTKEFRDRWEDHCTLKKLARSGGTLKTEPKVVEVLF